MRPVLSPIRFVVGAADPSNSAGARAKPHAAWQYVHDAVVSREIASNINDTVGDLDAAYP